METLELLRRSFNQYLVVLRFVSDLNKPLKLIDIGSQDSKLKEILPKNVEYKSLDMAGNADYKCDLNNKKIPIKSKTFDVSVCLETLEHVFYPDKVIKEIERITKDKGFIIISMPNEYNFWLRIKFLFAMNNMTDEAFEMVSKNLHIHRPRYKDIVNFSNKNLNVIKIIPLWQSRSSTQSKFFFFIDKILNLFAKIHPSLFSRLVVIIAKKKNEHTNN